MVFHEEISFSDTTAAAIINTPTNNHIFNQNLYLSEQQFTADEKVSSARS